MEDLFSTGWLSPDGEYIHCSTMDHYSVAADIVEERNIPCESSYYLDALTEHGWIQISFQRLLGHGYIFLYDGNNHATDAQKEFLRKYFDEEEEWVSEQGIRDLRYLGVIDDEEFQTIKDKRGMKW